MTTIFNYFCDFQIYFASIKFDPSIFFYPKLSDIQIACFMSFATNSEVPFASKKLIGLRNYRLYYIKSDDRNIPGLIYEWFSQYQELLMNRVTIIHQTGRNVNRKYLIGENIKMAASW